MPRIPRRGWLAGSAAALAIPALSALLSGCGPQRGAHPGGAPTPRGKPYGGLGFTAIHMVGASLGWAMGGAALFRSSDGGRTWSNVSPPSRPSAGTIVAAFGGASRAWAAMATPSGVQLFSTADGGAHWSAAVAPGSSNLVPRFLSFLTDSVHGWLWCAGATAPGLEPGVLFRTADGGATWTEAVSTGAASGAARGPGLPAAGVKSGLAFRDQNHGVMTATGAQRGTPWVYATADGGATWAPVTLGLPAAERSLPVGTQAPAFFDARHGLIPVLTFKAAIPALTVFVTADGGSTWTASLPVSSPYAALTTAFVDEGHWFATDGVGMYATATGGQGWSSYLCQPPKVLQGVAQLDFLSPGSGFAFCPPTPGTQGQAGARILATVDAGQSWQAVG